MVWCPDHWHCYRLAESGVGSGTNCSYSACPLVHVDYKNKADFARMRRNHGRRPRRKRK